MGEKRVLNSSRNGINNLCCRKSDKLGICSLLKQKQIQFQKNILDLGSITCMNNSISEGLLYFDFFQLTLKQNFDTS